MGTCSFERGDAMKKFDSDETAGSMIILVLGTAFFVFGLMYIVFSTSFNVPIDGFNAMIADGVVSDDTKNAFETMLDMWKAAPFFVIAGLIIYAFERSKGSEIPAQLYFEYLFMMVIGIVISTFLVYGVGIAADAITGALDASAIVNVSEVWESSGFRHFCVKLMYYTLMLPAFLTTLLYIFFPVIKQRENTFFTMDDGGVPPESVVDSDYSLGQF